jgi:glycosyltransferase involved in cell wall biosynthesis
MNQRCIDSADEFNKLGSQVPKKLLSVITPCRNSSMTIRDTIDSIQLVRIELERQGYLLEHIIIDGESTDGTAEIAREYAEVNKNVIFTEQPPAGIYSAMNIGLSLANGAYIHILNSDDFIVDPGKYVVLLNEARQEDADILIGSIAYLTNEDRPRPTRLWNVEQANSSDKIFKEDIKKGLHYPHPGFIAKTSIYRKNGFDVSYRFAADYKLMQEILLCLTIREKVLLRSDVIIGMREGGATSGIKGIIKGVREIKQINKELGIVGALWKRYIKKIAKRLRRSEEEAECVARINILLQNRGSKK